MEPHLKRREFIKKYSKICAGGCLLFSAPVSSMFMNQGGEPIDPEKLCFCGYSCPEDCNFLVASNKNDPGLKEKVFEEWDLAGRYGLKFDPEKIFCFTCKPGDQPEGPVLTNCMVRDCVIRKGYQACIQCDDLATCAKDLWERFPQFHDSVVELQVRYRSQKA